MTKLVSLKKKKYFLLLLKQRPIKNDFVSIHFKKNFIEKLKFFFDKTEGLLPDYLVSSDKGIEDELKKIFPSIKFFYHDFTNEKMIVHDYKKTKIFFEKKLDFLN